MKTYLFRLAIGLLPMSLALPVFAQSAESLPGGASSLQESYENWRVACAIQDSIKRCTLSQVQTQGDGQRVLAVELNAPEKGALNGTLVLPFGLALAKGVGLQIDEQASGIPLPFRTCLPAGCVVPLSFDQAATTALRNGAELRINVIADGGEDMTMPVSLGGFSAGLDRLNALAN